MDEQNNTNEMRVPALTEKETRIATAMLLDAAQTARSGLSGMLTITTVLAGSAPSEEEKEHYAKQTQLVQDMMMLLGSSEKVSAIFTRSSGRDRRTNPAQ